MPGPMPKDPMLRQRRNKASTKAVLSAEVDEKRRSPRLPKRDDGKEWHDLTRAFWRSLWKSPMASEYLDADIHALYRLTVLIDQFWREPTVSLEAQIARAQAAFGLTPLDRRRLEWSVAQAEQAQQKRQQRRPAEVMPMAPSDDPRSMFRVIN